MDIDLGALRLVERDREIPFNELVEIIEAAVEAAYHKSVGNSMMGAPYPHPHHLIFAKYLVYVWNGCGNHSMWVKSLNHCMMVSFGTQQVVLPRSEGKRYTSYADQWTNTKRKPRPTPNQ